MKKYQSQQRNTPSDLNEKIFPIPLGYLDSFTHLGPGRGRPSSKGLPRLRLRQSADNSIDNTVNGAYSLLITVE